MTTRATQFEILSVGYLYEGVPPTTGYVKFYAAGTSTAKNAYADKDKNSTFTQLALGSDGKGTAYGDGVYKLVFYDGDPDDGGSILETIDNQKCFSSIGDYSIVTANHTISPDDEVVFIDSSGGAITISFQTVANFSKPVKFIIIDNTNQITFDPYSSEYVNGSSSLVTNELYRPITFYPDTTNTAWYADEGISAPSKVLLTATDSITRVEHEGKMLFMDSTSAIYFVLPAATGSGARYKFFVKTVNTNGYIIKVNSASATIDGCIMGCADGGDTVVGWEADGTDDTITLNGTTTGGVTIGDWVELVDIATNQWAVSGQITQSGSEATPFSATVS